MLKYKGKHHHRQHFSLAARVSAMLVLAAILPLLITVVIIEFSSRPTLIHQASREMETDARTRTQLIDSYFAERILDSEAVSRLLPIQKFLAGDNNFKAQARNSLDGGQIRGSYYHNWSLFDLRGHLLLYSPAIPQLHGSSFIQADMLQQLQTSRKTLLSNVFYSPISNEAYIDIYTPVVTSAYTLVGILRTTFDLHYIWKIVDDEAGANGCGSYAFILDENGVRIAATNPHPDPENMTRSSLLFTSVAPISPTLQQRITSENLYGMQGGRTIVVLAEPISTTLQRGKALPSTFQMIPAGRQENFQVARWAAYTVPWTYYVLSPLSTIAVVADQQLQITSIIATIVLFLAIATGVFVGRRFALPIMRSIEAQQNAYKHQQQLSQLKDQFLINVSHELRTPLTEIYGYLELLLVHGNNLDTALKTTFLQHALSGCEELTLLINNVLDAIHTDNGSRPLHMQRVGVADAIHDVLDQFDPRTLDNYTIQVGVAETLCVEADPQSVRQVLRNLLSNAFKYAPPHTQIVISAQNGAHAAGNMGGEIAVCVKDQGPGITAGERDLLFNKFIRLQRDLSGPVRGTGLGLYISKQLVEAMGGEIWVESAGIPGEGSSFCFTLPAPTNNEETDSI